VGREIAALLFADKRYSTVHALVRKPSGLAHPKLVEHVVDFKKPLPDWPDIRHCDDVYIALGTTIKTAGSKEAFRLVDFDAVCTVAKFARAFGATRCGAVSAMGASPNSGVFYNRVKGETEQALRLCGFETLTIARPSFLAGNRQALAQTARAGEALALKVFDVLRPLIPRNYRSVHSSDVAAFVVDATTAGQPGVRVALSGNLQRSPA
jgi:uncharacterized protein YbjT (DUF2867 family)